jgi:hypothetical protein
LIPGAMPRPARSSGIATPWEVFCRIVSSNRITPLIASASPGVVKRVSRYARRFGSVFGMPSSLKRLSMVGKLSSAARMPLPGARRAWGAPGKAAWTVFAA